jgi:hypothetical protein
METERASAEGRMTYRKIKQTWAVTVAFLIPAGLSFAQTPAAGAARNCRIDSSQAL